MKLIKVLFYILFPLGLIFNFLCTAYVNGKLEEIDNAVYEHIKDELNNNVNYKRRRR